MNGQKGITLIEVMITSGLFLLVTVMMIALLLPSFSLFRKQSGQSDAYRACLQTVERFRLEMLNTQLESLTLTPDRQAIAWQEVQTDPPFSGTSGEPISSDVFTVLHYRDERVLLTRTDPSGAGPSTIPSRLGLEEIEVLRTRQSRVLARDITAFEVSDNDPDSPLISPPIRMALSCTIDTKGRASNDEESFRMSVTVTPRSQRW